MQDQFSTPLATFADVQAFLERYAAWSYAFPKPTPPSPALSLDRTRTFLARIGNPHQTLKVIHVAGTTGKGTTCMYLEAALRAQGIKTGLSVSPHVSDLRERFQVNGELISEERCVRLLDEIREALCLIKTLDEFPRYAELLQTAAYLLFAQEKVQYSVIETGIGGRFDASNVLDRTDKYCVITKLGFDHVELLGKTIEQIAWQKIGIVHPGNRVAIGRQELIDPDQLVPLAMEEGASAVRSFQEQPLSTFISFLQVPYLRENAWFAQKCLEQIAQHDGWDYRSVLAEEAFARLHLALRFERIAWQGKTLILDAAHNPQKMEGLVAALRASFPDQSIAAVLAFNPQTDISVTAQPLLACVQRLACVDFVAGQGSYRFHFSDPTEAARLLTVAGAPPPNVFTDWPTLSTWIKTIPESIIVLTGSFHFAASVRGRLVEE